MFLLHYIFLHSQQTWLSAYQFHRGNRLRRTNKANKQKWRVRRLHIALEWMCKREKEKESNHFESQSMCKNVQKIACQDRIVSKDRRTTECRAIRVFGGSGRRNNERNKYGMSAAFRDISTHTHTHNRMNERYGIHNQKLCINVGYKVSKWVLCEQV